MDIETLYDGNVPVAKTVVGKITCNSNNVSLQYSYVGTSLTLSIEMSVNGSVYEEITELTVVSTEDKAGIINIQDLTINTKLQVKAVGDGTIKLDSLY